MLNVFYHIQKRNDTNNKYRGWEETFGGDGYVYSINVVLQVYTYLHIHQVVYNKYVQIFVCQPYLNKGIEVWLTYKKFPLVLSNQMRLIS